MVYISSDGSVVQGSPPAAGHRKVLNSIGACWTAARPEIRALVVVAVAMALRFGTHWTNPLSHGAIPAADRLPNQHWSHLAEGTVLVRTLTDHLSRIAPTKATTPEGRQAIENHKYFEFIEYVDFGGADGHIAERVDISSVESLRVTRCSTTRSAVTAYFCGAAVATNQDVALGNQRKGMNGGVQSLRDFLQCRYRQGQANRGGHKPSVYRLGIGCNDPLAGYSHAWSIVAQPDGSFFWLQSYISRYSLGHWMSRVDPNTGRPLGQLSLTELLAKLEQIGRLMQIDDWTYQANRDYLELFGVDKNKEAFQRANAVEWKPTHRLEHFYWDEACEYPVPAPSLSASPSSTPPSLEQEEEEENGALGNDNGDAKIDFDECEIQNLVSQLARGVPVSVLEQHLLQKETIARNLESSLKSPG